MRGGPSSPPQARLDAMKFRDSSGSQATVSVPSDFLISYAAADQNWAEWIAWVLEAEGYRSQLQLWDLRSGSNFMRGSEVAAPDTIAVLSPAYFESPFTHA